MIKIVAGSLRGRTIVTSSSFTQRPTLGRVRESIFNMLKSRIDFDEYYFIDLFAGSGAVGIEAFSQGFKHCLLIEKGRENCINIKKNCNKFSIPEEKLEIIHSDSLNWIDNSKKIDGPIVFFLDPPYHSNLYEESLNKIQEKNLFKDKSYLVIEKDLKTKIELKFETIIKQKKYASSEIILLKNS